MAIARDAPSGGAEVRGEGEARGDEAELARYLCVHGVFRNIAVEIARRYLAKMSLQEAEVEALAWAIAIQASKDVQSGLIDEAMATGRLVTRLRQMAGPPVWALDAAWAELEDFWGKLPGRPAEGAEPAEAGAWDEVVNSNLPY